MSKNQESEIEELEREKEVVQKETDSLQIDPDTDTRQIVATMFVRFYFFILILIILVVPAYDYLVMEQFKNAELLVPLKDIILTYSAVVGPTIGLVVAYYFKSKNN